MRHLIAAAMIAVFAVPALADPERRAVDGTVTEAMDRLEAAVTGAGATVFARVDHGAGAAQAGLPLGASQLLIFGNPQLGTPIMQDDPLAGLVLPLKMLVYADEGGQVWVAWRPVGDVVETFEVSDHLAVLGRIDGALENFAGAAAGD